MSWALEQYALLCNAPMPNESVCLMHCGASKISLAECPFDAEFTKSTTKEGE